MIKILLLALAALSAPHAFADSSGADFATPHRLVDVGGRRLNLSCVGTGSPTVVFESPSGAGGAVWWAVRAPVAGLTRACAYDRAGFGFSDSSPRGADADAAVDDLHALLAAAGIAPPYVLVGNSFGGGAAELFAWKHPAEVVGLVLVEPMHEDELVLADAVTHGGMSDAERQILEFGDACEAQSLKGFDPKSETWEGCIGGPDPGLPAAVAQIDLRQRQKPDWWHVRQAERRSLTRDRAQLRAARKPFGDLPLIVLARGVSPYLIPGKPQSDTNKAIEAANLALLTELARSSTQGEVRIVAGAGHEIQAQRPDAVVTAVTDLVARIRR